MNILITGASSGIGFQTALQLAEHGHTVFAVARSANKLQELKAANNAIQAITGDITEEHFLHRLKQEISFQTNTLNVLINNAGYLVNKPFETLTPEDWQEVYSTNLFAPVNLIKMLLPLFPSTGKSHIVNIASMGGIQGSKKFKGLSAYSSAKAALIGLTECLAEEFADKNIAVNCLALGSAQTEMFSKAFPGVTAGTTAETMAHFVAQFATEGHKLFNGKIIPVANSTP
jgi:NAD(P)-dependent dehydrogenase (short-subunit alcohol dehydrogenase family)